MKKTTLDLDAAQAESDFNAARHYRELVHELAKIGKFAGTRRSRPAPLRDEADFTPNTPRGKTAAGAAKRSTPPPPSSSDDA